jgi:hypothetical protein
MLIKHHWIMAKLQLDMGQLWFDQKIWDTRCYTVHLLISSELVFIINWLEVPNISKYWDIDSI